MCSIAAAIIVLTSCAQTPAARDYPDCHASERGFVVCTPVYIDSVDIGAETFAQTWAGLDYTDDEINAAFNRLAIYVVTTAQAEYICEQRAAGCILPGPVTSRAYISSQDRDRHALDCMSKSALHHELMHAVELTTDGLLDYDHDIYPWHWSGAIVDLAARRYHAALGCAEED